MLTQSTIDTSKFINGVVTLVLAPFGCLLNMIVIHRYTMTLHDQTLQILINYVYACSFSFRAVKLELSNSKLFDIDIYQPTQPITSLTDIRRWKMERKNEIQTICC